MRTYKSVVSCWLFTMVFFTLVGTAKAVTVTYTGNVYAENNLIAVSFPGIPDLVPLPPAAPFYIVNMRMFVSADFTCRPYSPGVLPGQPDYCGFQNVFGGFSVEGAQSLFGNPGVGIHNANMGRQFPMQDTTIFLDSLHKTISIRTLIEAHSELQSDFPVTVALSLSFSDPRLGEPVFLSGGLNAQRPDPIPLPAALPLMLAALSAFGILQRRRTTAIRAQDF